jgi:hypothetical protein
LLAFLFVRFLNQYLSNIEVFMDILGKNNFEYLLIIFVTGPVLVLLVSVFTLRKLSLKI